MSQKTKIEWTESTWNPVSGCDKISAGCANCYAEKMAKRLQAMGTKGYKNGFKVTLHPDRLSEPTNRKKPTMYFVCSMGDLFHDDVPFEFIDKILHTIIQTPQHTFQILTKRPERMQEYFNSFYSAMELCDREFAPYKWWDYLIDGVIPNLWLGVTAENQEQADNRIPILLGIPATKRFVSIEPMLSKIDLTKLEKDMSDGTYYGYKMNGLTGIGYEYIPESSCEQKWAKLDWVICGGETGANARPLHPNWVRSLRDQCQEANVPFFFKQWGEWIYNNFNGELLPDRVGKKQAGHLLDGIEYREIPL